MQQGRPFDKLRGDFGLPCFLYIASGAGIGNNASSAVVRNLK